MIESNYIEFFNLISKKKHLARKFKSEYILLEKNEEFIHINNPNYNILSITPKLLLKCGFKADKGVYRKEKLTVIPVHSVNSKNNEPFIDFLINFYGYVFLENKNETENFIEAYKKNISDKHFDDFIKTHNTTMSIDELRKFLKISLPNFDKIMIDYYNDNPFAPLFDTNPETRKKNVL